MEKQLTTTLHINGTLALTQWMFGFNVVDDRPVDNVYGSVMVNLFFGPTRIGLTWEPRRQEQLNLQAEVDRQQAKFERDLDELEKRHR